MGSCMPVFGTASSDSAIGAQEDRMRVLNPVAADKKKDVNNHEEQNSDFNGSKVLH